MKDKKSIFVLDGEQKSALAATRSLGKAGIKVITGSPFISSLSGASKYSYKQVKYSSPFIDPIKFIEDIKAIIVENNVDLLLPMTDASVFTILSHENELNSFVKILSGHFNNYIIASDKFNLLKTAIKLNIPIPNTIFIESSDDIERCKNILKYPIILKPQMSIIKDNNQLKQTSVKIVNSYEEILDLVKNTITFKKPFMIQEKISGEGLGIFTLFNNGQPERVFSHRRLREKPPWGGVSVLCESTRPDPMAKEYAIKLLKELNWDGVAMVEFKRDLTSGAPKLMEINARFWGSLQLAIDAGIDFPCLLYLKSQGEPIPNEIEAKHTRLRWLLGDLDSLYITLKTKRGSEKLPANFPSRIQSIIAFIKEFKNDTKFEILRYEDITPFMWEFKQYIRSLISKKIR